MTKEKVVEVDEALQHVHLFFISCEYIIMILFPCYRIAPLSERNTTQIIS